MLVCKPSSGFACLLAAAMLAGAPLLEARHGSAPLNSVTNGGFDDNLDAWTQHAAGCAAGPVTHVTGGAEGTTGAISVEKFGAANCFLYQHIEPSIAPIVVASFQARTEGDPQATGLQGFGLYGPGHPPDASPANRVATLRIGVDTLDLTVFNGDRVEAGNISTVGDWHRYDLILIRPAGLGFLFIDDELALAAHGDGLAAPPIADVWFGDGVGSSSGGLNAPQVTWDEVFVGPGI